MAVSRVVLLAVAEVLSRSSPRVESQHWFVAGAGVPRFPCPLAETSDIARIVAVAISLMGTTVSRGTQDNAANVPAFRRCQALKGPHGQQLCISPDYAPAGRSSGCSMAQGGSRTSTSISALAGKAVTATCEHVLLLAHRARLR